MLKIGCKIGPEQFPPSEMLEQVVAAEKSGFESIDVSDHFHPWSEDGQSCFTWTWLGAAAVKTKTIELGPGVTCPIGLRYNPAILAQAAATVSAMAGGRTYLGVGTGEALNEYPVTAEWPSFDDRQAMMVEAVQLIRRLWTGEKVDFEGCYFRTREAKLYTPPKNEIPIIISTLVPDSAYLAGYYGDGIMTVGGSEVSEYEQILSEAKRGATDAGRDFDKMPKAIELLVDYTDDVEKAVESFKKYWAGALVPAMFTCNLYTPTMSAQNGQIVGKDTIQKSVLISGDPEKQIEFVKQYIDAGFTHLYIHSASQDKIDFIERYGKDILPALKKMG